MFNGKMYVSIKYDIYNYINMVKFFKMAKSFFKMYSINNYLLEIFNCLVNSRLHIYVVVVAVVVGNGGWQYLVALVVVIWMGLKLTYLYWLNLTFKDGLDDLNCVLRVRVCAQLF